MNFDTIVNFLRKNGARDAIIRDKNKLWYLSNEKNEENEESPNQDIENLVLNLLTIIMLLCYHYRILF